MSLSSAIVPGCYELSPEDPGHEWAINFLVQKMRGQAHLDEIKVWTIFNPLVTNQFNHRCRVLYDKNGYSNKDLMFHGTTWAKAQEFAVTGFTIPALRPERTRLAGANLYFERNPFKAMQYSMPNTRISDHVTYTLMITEVALGAVQTYEYPDHEDVLYGRVKLRPVRIAGLYDSLAINTSSRDEAVVPRPDQTRPLFVVRFKWANVFDEPSLNSRLNSSLNSRR